MSLVKKVHMSEKQLAANRQNQNLCHPIAEEGRERIPAALLRFGFDVQAEEIAMRALGEDPAHFQGLLEELWKEWNPAGGLQEGVVISLGRAMWLMNRAARMQEGYAVRQAQEASSGRQDRVHARMMRLKMTEERLKRLAESVACEHYVTPLADLEKMKSLHQDGALKDMGEIALALFYQLQAPGTGEDGIDRDEISRRALARIKDIFGLSGDTPPQPRFAPNFRQPQENPQNAQAGVAPDLSPAPANPSQSSGQALQVGSMNAPANLNVPATNAIADPSHSSGQAPKVGATRLEENKKRYPSITPAEWEARKRPRQLLENLLTRQMESCKEQRKAILKESVKGPSPYERAAEIAPTHPDVRLMRRMQDCNLREVRRLTNLLLKLKRYELRMEAAGKGAAFHDVPETKGVSNN